MDCSSLCIYRRALACRSYTKISDFVEKKEKCSNHPLCLVRCILSSLTSISLDNVVKLICSNFHHDLNKYKDDEGNTLLGLLAAKLSQYQKVINIILESNIDINVVDSSGYTFFMSLLRYKKCSLAIQIINNLPLSEFDFNRKGNDGHTLLTLLCKYITENYNNKRTNYQEMIRLLLNKGCDPNVSSPMKYIIRMNNPTVKDLILDSGYMMDEDDIIEPNRCYLDNIVIPCIRKLRRKHKIIGVRGTLSDGTVVGAKKARSWFKCYLGQRQTHDWEEYCSYIGNSYIKELRNICSSLGIVLNTSNDMYEDTYREKKVRYKINNKIHTKTYKKLVVRYYVGDGKVSIRHKLMQREAQLKNYIKYNDRLIGSLNTETTLTTPIEDIVPSRYIIEPFQDGHYAFEIAEVKSMIDNNSTPLLNPYTRQQFSKRFMNKAHSMILACEGNTGNEGYLPPEFNKVYRESDEMLYDVCGPNIAQCLVSEINSTISSNIPFATDLSFMLNADVSMYFSIINMLRTLNTPDTIPFFTQDLTRESNIDVIRYIVLKEIHRYLAGAGTVIVSLMLNSVYKFTVEE